MTTKMQTFLSINRETPLKRAADLRVKDYQEISEKFKETVGRTQASRCEQCGNPGCEYLCPLGNYILDWLRLASEGDFIQAAQVAQSTNTFPEICGRICPQDRLCEKNCILNIADEGAVTIGAVEAWVTDFALEQGLDFSLERLPDNGNKVAVIGSGPAGLSCAGELHQKGYQVTVFERSDEAGGLLLYGIPNFKLDKEIVKRRVRMLQSKGVEIRFNAELGVDFDLNDLKKDGYQAIFLGFGAYQAKELKIPGAELDCIHKALPYLISTNRMNLGVENLNNKIDVCDKDVVVLGGGDTAMDCIRTALRQGAKSVRCVYRRDRLNMPGSQKEVTHAIEEGAEFLFLTDAVEIKAVAGRAEVKLQKMQLGARDDSGRQKIIQTDEFMQITADIILVAFGFDVQKNNSLAALGVKTNSDQMVSIDDNGMTSVEGVFAGGDCARGASLVVWAIRDGRDVAEGIHRYIKSCQAAFF